ncbi:MAG: NUDIX hydrolase [Phenylobacterium sp.]
MIIEVVAGLIRDADGRLLTVRKAGTGAYMLPGGKREPGEDDLAALARELRELGVRLVSAEKFGNFEAAAINEPGARVRSEIYSVTVEGPYAPGAEIADLLWLDAHAPGEIPLAHLIRDHVLPRLS